jgi:hypothetical protein
MVLSVPDLTDHKQQDLYRCVCGDLLAGLGSVIISASGILWREEAGSFGHTMGSSISSLHWHLIQH